MHMRVNILTTTLIAASISSSSGCDGSGGGSGGGGGGFGMAKAFGGGGFTGALSKMFGGFKSNGAEKSERSRWQGGSGEKYFGKFSKGDDGYGYSRGDGGKEKQWSTFNKFGGSSKQSGGYSGDFAESGGGFGSSSSFQSQGSFGSFGGKGFGKGFGKGKHGGGEYFEGIAGGKGQGSASFGSNKFSFGGPRKPFSPFTGFEKGPFQAIFGSKGQGPGGFGFGFGGVGGDFGSAGEASFTSQQTGSEKAGRGNCKHKPGSTSAAAKGGRNEDFEDSSSSTSHGSWSSSSDSSISGSNGRKAEAARPFMAVTRPRPRKPQDRLGEKQNGHHKEQQQQHKQQQEAGTGKENSRRPFLPIPGSNPSKQQNNQHLEITSTSSSSSSSVGSKLRPQQTTEFVQQHQGTINAKQTSSSKINNAQSLQNQNATVVQQANSYKATAQQEKSQQQESMLLADAHKELAQAFELMKQQSEIIKDMAKVNAAQVSSSSASTSSSSATSNVPFIKMPSSVSSSNVPLIQMPYENTGNVPLIKMPPSSSSHVAHIKMPYNGADSVASSGDVKESTLLASSLSSSASASVHSKTEGYVPLINIPAPVSNSVVNTFSSGGGGTLQSGSAIKESSVISGSGSLVSSSTASEQFQKEYSSSKSSLSGQSSKITSTSSSNINNIVDGRDEFATSDSESIVIGGDENASDSESFVIDGSKTDSEAETIVVGGTGSAGNGGFKTVVSSSSNYSSKTEGSDANGKKESHTVSSKDVTVSKQDKTGSHSMSQTATVTDDGKGTVTKEEHKFVDGVEVQVKKTSITDA